MRAMTLQLLRIYPARDTNNEPELAIRAGFHPGKGILNHDRSFGLDREKSCRRQERVRGRFSGKALSFDDIAVHPHLEELVQSCGSEDGIAVLTGRDDG